MPKVIKDTHISFKCTARMKQRLEDVADYHKISVSSLCRDMVAKSIKQREVRMDSASLPKPLPKYFEGSNAD